MCVGGAVRNKQETEEKEPFEVAVQKTSGYTCRLLFLCQSKFSNAQKFCYKHKKGG